MHLPLRSRAAVVGVVAIIGAGLPMPAHAQTAAVNWEREAPSQSPPARTFAASAYDSTRNRVVLFGGSSDGSSNLGDTWEWDGSSWTKMVPPVSPGILAGAAMAYDSARGRSVLFGGASPTAVSSATWEWDGVSWAQRNLSTSPPPMVWTAMVYDSTRSRMVLFGAFNQFGLWLSETWEFDGTTWTQAHPVNSPSPRRGPGMAFDSVRHRVVMFGGEDPNAGRMADTWEWDGTNWMQINTTVAPYQRFWHSMAFDPVRSRTILFGGDHFQPYALGAENDTWEWDGTQWTRDWTAAAPSVRAGQSMVYDSALGRMVLFGGFNAGVNPNTFSNETWELGTGIVTPPGTPALSISPTTGEFGSVDVGATSAVAVYSVAGSGTGPSVTTLSATGDFAVSFTDCPNAPDPLAAGTTCLVFVTFKPTTGGDRYGTLTFTGNLASGSLTISLHGFGLASDFTIAANPSTINTTVGYPVPAVTVSTKVIGSSGTIALSALTTDPGITVSFNPSSISAGTSSTMTILLGPSVTPGSYGVRVTGTEGTVTHYVDVSIQVFPVPDFTIAAGTATVALAQGSSAQVAITTTAINGVASISLSTGVAPSGPTATFSSPYVGAGSFALMTVSAGYGVAPGVYTVTVTGIEGSKVHSTTVSVTVTLKGIVNGGFEAGDLTGWTQAGADAAVRFAHTGAFGGQVGSALAFTGDSTLSQTFTVPASGGKLVFWYWNFCNDKVKNDWFTVTLQDGVTGGVSTLQSPICSNTGGWTKVTANMSSHAGHFVTLTFLEHDDGTGSTESWTVVDDVALT